MTKSDAIAHLWEYHQMHHMLTPADIIFVLGSNDERVALYAAELFHRKLAPYIVFSGGAGRFTEGLVSTEAERFAAVAQKHGVPLSAILIENKSTNTGENIQFTCTLLKQHDITPKSVIALQKPYMERRTLATLEAQWAKPTMPSLIISSPPFSFQEYLTPELSENLVISAMVGDYQRIKEYPKQGFSTPQPYSSLAEEAFHTLVALGYTSQLIPHIPV